MTKRFEVFLNGTLTLAAVVMVAIFAKRELFPRPVVEPRSPTGLISAPEYRPEWEQTKVVGRELGDSTSKVKIVVFMDLECPACRQFHRSALAEFRRREEPWGYSLAIVHFPLRIHPFAFEAARAAECVSNGHQFEAFVDTVLAQQSKIGRKSWSEFATEVGVTDSVQFVQCYERDLEPFRVEGGLRVASELGIRATPTVVVNGWVLPVPPSADELLRITAEVRQGRAPFASEK